MIEKIVREYLLDDDDVRDIVGSRIYVGYVPGGVTGAVIVLRKISTERTYHLLNEAGARADVVQIDCYDETGTQAYQLSEIVRNRLSGAVTQSVSYLEGDYTTGQIHYAWIINERELAEEPENASDRWTHRYSVDYEIGVSQSVPTHT